ncbi:MAG: phosphoribosyltransferase [Planctomycetales bacterium]
MEQVYENRADAGRTLAGQLEQYAGQADVLVLGLPRGGIPVACEVAAALGVEMDVLIVRKLGFPGQEELAMGAIASGGIRVLNDRVIEMAEIPDEIIERVTQRELAELQRREQAYRGDRPQPAIAGRTVLLVDDGLATGSTMRAAIATVRTRQPAKIVVAVPVAPSATVAALRHEADEVVCLMTPVDFFGIGQFYVDFTQLTDNDVRRLLAAAWRKSGGAANSRSHLQGRI